MLLQKSVLRFQVLICLSFIIFIVIPSGLFAQSLSEKKVKAFFMHRTRMTAWDHAIHLDRTKSSTAFTRHLTKLGFEAYFSQHLEFKLGMANEFRAWLQPHNIEIQLSHNETSKWSFSMGIFCAR